MNAFQLKKIAFVACAVGAILSQHISEACTGLLLKAKDGSFVHGRTLEFGVQVNPSITVIPRGYEFVGSTPTGKGLKYKSKYGAIGAVAYDQIAILDGLNEKGLAVGTFYFPGYAKYAEITNENQNKALSPVDFPNWIVTQFATVEEVKSALSDIVIAPTVIKGWGEGPAPFHYIVYDNSGKSLVIEPVDGRLITFDNPLGVLTNSPEFDWHMTNLHNYVNLRKFNVSPLKIDGVEFAPFGQGSGLVGLPGDFTPPSRFVQASIFKVTALTPGNTEDAVFQLFHILNHFDIPKGTVSEKDGSKVFYDFTSVTCVRDPQNLKFFFKTYDDQTIRVVDLKKFNLEEKKIKIIGSSQFNQQPIVDISAELK